MTVVLDASALLALILEEQGTQAVIEALADRPAMTTVNLGEVAHRLTLLDRDRQRVAELLDWFPLTLIDVDRDLALGAGFAAALSKPFGLSFADRLCLMLAKRLGQPALTADRRMADAADTLGVMVRLIR